MRLAAVGRFSPLENGMQRRHVILICALALVVGLPGTASGQVEASLGVMGGNASDVTGATSAAVSLSPALRYQAEPGLALTLGGNGTRYQNGQWALGGSGQLSLTTRMSSWLRFALDGTGSVTTTSFSYSGASLEAAPRLQVGTGPLTAFGGYAGAAGSFSTGSAGPRSFGPFAGNLSTTQTRQSHGPFFGAVVRLTPAYARVAALLSAREVDRSIETERFTDRSATLLIAGGPARLDATLGYRHAPDEQRTFGGVSLNIMLAPQVAFAAAAQSYPSNPLTGTAAGRAITAGLVLHFGLHRPAPPQPSEVAPVAASHTRLTIAAPDAHRVEVAGDWNGWHPQPAVRAQNGVWYVDLALPAGDYRYAFRIDGKTWRVPRGVTQMDDPFGGKAALVRVE